MAACVVSVSVTDLRTRHSATIVAARDRFHSFANTVSSRSLSVCVVPPTRESHKWSVCLSVFVVVVCAPTKLAAGSHMMSTNNNNNTISALLPLQAHFALSALIADFLLDDDNDHFSQR